MIAVELAHLLSLPIQRLNGRHNNSSPRSLGDTPPRYSCVEPRWKLWRIVSGKLLKRWQIQEVLTAPRSPWQNAYVERLIGSIRRDCLGPCAGLQ